MATTTRIGKQNNPSLLRATDFGSTPQTSIGYRILLEGFQSLISAIGWDRVDAICAAVRTRYSALASAPVQLGVAAPAVNNVVSAQVGKPLHLVMHDVDGMPKPTVSFQWKRGASTSISGATARDYTPQVADVGSTLKCTITWTNGVGSDLVQTTAPTNAVLAA